MEIPKSEIERVKENLRRQDKWFNQLSQLPEYKEQGKIFKNWVAHINLLSYISEARCPTCKINKLTWDCCGLTIQDGLDILREKVPEHAEEVKQARKRANIELDLIPFPR